jgi:arylsulfatase A-like enzyme
MYLPGNIPTFVELLRNRGFRTAAFIDDNPFVCSLLGYNRGFDLVRDYFVESMKIKQKLNYLNAYDIRRILHHVKCRVTSNRYFCFYSDLFKYMACSTLVQPKKNTEQIIGEAINFFKTYKTSCFVWIHLMDTHWPFYFPPRCNPQAKYGVMKARNQYSEIPGSHKYSQEIGELMEEMYDTSISNVDIKLKYLFNMLKEEGIKENTYVFLTADHGEEFLERGSLDHQENVYQEVARVPLVIKKPGIDNMETVESTVSLLDIAPTILLLEKISVPKEYQGVSIFHGGRDYCISETVVPTVKKLASIRKDIYRVPLNDFAYAIRDARYTIIYDRDGRYKFFDRSENIPEKRPIQSLNTEIGRLLNILEEHQLSCPNTEVKKLKDRIRGLKRGLYLS